MARALENDKEANDYILKLEHNTVWITVGNIAVQITRKADGVQVHLCDDSNEEIELASCFSQYP